MNQDVTSSANPNLDFFETAVESEDTQTEEYRLKDGDQLAEVLEEGYSFVTSTRFPTPEDRVLCWNVGYRIVSATDGHGWTAKRVG